MAAISRANVDWVHSQFPHLGEHRISKQSLAPSIELSSVLGTPCVQSLISHSSYVIYGSWTSLVCARIAGVPQQISCCPHDASAWVILDAERSIRREENSKPLQSSGHGVKCRTCKQLIWARSSCGWGSSWLNQIRSALRRHQTSIKTCLLRHLWASTVLMYHVKRTRRDS